MTSLGSRVRVQISTSAVNAHNTWDAHMTSLDSSPEESGNQSPTAYAAWKPLDSTCQSKQNGRRDADNTFGGPGTKGCFRLAVPPAPFSLTLSAPRYDVWYGNGSRLQPALFEGEGRDQQEIPVRLRFVTSR